MTDELKLLHISPSYYPALKFGGPIQSVHLLNKALVKKGVKVDVLTTDAGLSQDQRIKIKEQSKEILRSTQNDTSIHRQSLSRPVGTQDDKEEWNDVDGVRVKYLSFIGYVHYNLSFGMLKEIWKIIDNYDLVHITAVWNFPVLAGALISLIKKRPYIISPRGTLYKETIELKSTSFKKLYFNLFAKHYLNRASGIHFTTEDEKQKVIEHLKLKAPSFVIPNGIDLKEIENGDQRSERRIRENYILILGRIDKKKGFDLLIPTFSNIIKSHNDLHLVIAGDQSTPYTQSVNQTIKELGLGERVIFTGEVTGDDKWALYNNALMFVLPSYSENFGMSVVEAMACGCPVVISDKVGIYKEVADNNAGIVVETNPESLEKGIEQLLNDVALRKDLALNGKAMVEKYYNIDNVAEQMIEQYERIVDGVKSRKKEKK